MIHRYTSRPALLLLATLLLVSAVHAELPEAAVEDLSILPIQSGGRVRTFDAYTRDVVHEVTGDHEWNGELPLETVMDWAANPAKAYAEPLFPLVHEPLRNEIGLTATDPTRFSMETLVSNEELVRIAEQAQEAQQAGRDLTIQQAKSVELFNRISMLHGVLTANDLRLIPPEPGSDTWRSITTVMSDTTHPGATVALGWTGLIESTKRGDTDMIVTSAKVVNETLMQWSAGAIDEQHLAAELFYRQMDPWTIAKWLYVLAIVFAIAGTFVKKPWMDSVLPRVMLLAGFLVHTGGLALRWYIAERAPWSNMYESLTTAAWGVVLFGLFKYRGAASKIVAPAAAFIGFTSLFIASHQSLDPSIDPLVPALQSYWMNIHVIVILLGYSAAALAAVLGHLWIVNDVFRPERKRLLNGIYGALYKMVQLAVLFLIVGILLGSVWAHSAWGRYWGWDPKETWALITWIFYLALIHAGYAGWMRERGMAIASVVGLVLVVFTYYGVNYFLSGLHTYASGNAVDVPPTAIGFVIFEALFIVAYAFYRYTKSRGERRDKELADREPSTESV